MKFDDIFHVKHNWKRIDKEEFFSYRIQKIKSESSEDFANLSTTGSSSCRPLKYKWGPNFAQHHALYDEIFYDGQGYVHLFILPHSENSLRRTEKTISLGVNDSIPNNSEKLLKNVHVVSNPEVLYIYMKRYGDFVDDFFDKKTCTFSFTGSPLRKEFKSLFASLGMRCKDHMRCWDGGATYYTCPNMKTHWVDFSSIIRFDGQKLISTDLWNTAQKFVDYWNNDRLLSRPIGKCDCGLEAVEIEWMENPRYFVVKGKEHCYDSIVEAAKEYGEFDFLSVKYSDNFVSIDICSLGEMDTERLCKRMQDKMGIKVEAKITKLPEYRRKYRRISKFRKIF